MKREDLSNAMKDDKQKIERVWKNKNKRAKKKKKEGDSIDSPLCLFRIRIRGSKHWGPLDAS